MLTMNFSVDDLHHRALFSIDDNKSLWTLSDMKKLFNKGLKLTRNKICCAIFYLQNYRQFFRFRQVFYLKYLLSMLNLRHKTLIMMIGMFSLSTGKLGKSFPSEILIKSNKTWRRSDGSNSKRGEFASPKPALG